MFCIKNTAEGDPAVFFYAMKKHKKAPARCCAFLPKDTPKPQNGAHLCQKADVFFVFSAN
jgi:hypothetical protein